MIEHKDFIPRCEQLQRTFSTDVEDGIYYKFTVLSKKLLNAQASLVLNINQSSSRSQHLWVDPKFEYALQRYV